MKWTEEYKVMYHDTNSNEVVGISRIFIRKESFYDLVSVLCPPFGMGALDVRSVQQT